MVELLPVDDLPESFRYPPEFVRVVELGLIDLEPWLILTGDYLRQRFEGMRGRYRTKVYVPFAEKQDTRDFACWTGPSPEVRIVHDFASPGWELRDPRSFPNFHAWLRQALEDFIERGEMDLGL